MLARYPPEHWRRRNCIHLREWNWNSFKRPLHMPPEVDIPRGIIFVPRCVAKAKAKARPVPKRIRGSVAQEVVEVMPKKVKGSIGREVTDLTDTGASSSKESLSKEPMHVTVSTPEASQGSVRNQRKSGGSDSKRKDPSTTPPSASESRFPGGSSKFTSAELERISLAERRSLKKRDNRSHSR